MTVPLPFHTLLLPLLLFLSLPIIVSANDDNPYYINPTFFGQDLEFTRHDLFTGISAELLANRKFATPTLPTSSWPSEVQQLIDEGIVPRWDAIGSPKLDAPYYANHDDLITGDVGNSIYCPANSNASCGVEQGTYFGGYDSGEQATSCRSIDAER